MTEQQMEIMHRIAETLVASRVAWKEHNASRHVTLYERFRREVSMYCSFLGMTEQECKQTATAMADAFMA